jgi:taurine dioxygenase
MRVTPCTPFGAEVELDLRRIGAEDGGKLRALFDRHHLLVFRNQSLSQAAQIDFMALFGPILRSRIDGVGTITNLPGPENFLGDSELAFHSDLAFSPKPFLAISLHALEVENGRSSTRFVDSTASYKRLPSALKSRVDGLHALHVFGADLAGRNLDDLPSHLPRTAHPLVMRHPRTGEKILYVNYNQTARIVELDPSQSDALIEELFAFSYPEEAVLEHRWNVGDVVAWDNLALQHARGPVANVGVRRLQRVVCAEAGFFEQHPEFGKHELAM